MRTRGNKYIHIVGVGADGVESLTDKALGIIKKSQILIGGRRILSHFSSFPAKKIEILSNIDKIIEVVKENRDKMVVILASGDPNHYGISKRIFENFPKKDVKIIPNVSSMQLAFAAIREPMDGAVITSVHGRGTGNLLETVRNCHKIGIYTDPENDPARIASMLIKNGIDGFTAYVCENLGTMNEMVFKGRLADIAKKEFSPLNVMILIRDRNLPEGHGAGIKRRCVLGIADDQLLHRGGMITKLEIRVVALARLRLYDGITLWDIGAGSGSVSIEAAGLIPNGMVYAIEKDNKQLTHLSRNIKRFQRRNIIVCEGKAPDILDQLPDPDRIFIGGSGGRLKEILAEVNKRIRLQGIVVLNAVTTSTLTGAIEILNGYGFRTEITNLNIARSRGLGDAEILDPLTPTFIISGDKIEG